MPPVSPENLADAQARLQEEASHLRSLLGLDALLAEVGEAHLVGSAALGLMVWPDLDMTVVCDVLDHDAVFSVAGALGRHPAVRSVLFRDDTGHWNQDPRYPDGLYLGVECVGEADQLWNIDIWFVDEPDRQPDLHHVRALLPRLTDETRAAILSIKHDQRSDAETGKSVASYDIYQAVLDGGVRSPAEFRSHMRRASGLR